MRWEAAYGFVIPSELSPSAKRSDLMSRDISRPSPERGLVTRDGKSIEQPPEWQNLAYPDLQLMMKPGMGDHFRRHQQQRQDRQYQLQPSLAMLLGSQRPNPPRGRRVAPHALLVPQQ